MLTSPPLNWQLEQLLKLQRTRPELVQRAMQEILAADEELRWSLVVSAYLDESISLGKAAELLEMHPIELRKIFLAKGIPLRLGPISKEEAQAEIDALRTDFPYSNEITHSLLQLPGMSEEYSDLLKEAGISSISSLSQYTPEVLYHILSDINSQNKIVTKLPSTEVINSWIVKSKAITRVVAITED